MNPFNDQKAYHNNDKFSVVLFQIVPSFTIHPSICHLPIHIHSFNQFQIHSISLSIIPYHAIPIQSFHLPFLLPFLIHMHPQYLVKKPNRIDWIHPNIHIVNPYLKMTSLFICLFICLFQVIHSSIQIYPTISIDSP